MVRWTDLQTYTKWYIKLLKDYSLNRKQRVVLNGSTSDISSIESGVQQGSVLDTLLFLIYINDLEANIKSKIKFFGDPTLTTSELNHLDLINKRAYQWKMAFNPETTKQADVLFSQHKLDYNHLPLFNGSMVLEVDAHKHLGLTLDSNHLLIILMIKL